MNAPLHDSPARDAPPEGADGGDHGPERGPLRESLRSAAWLAPLGLPAAVMHFALIAAPWLDSLEAIAERRLIARSDDLALREAFGEALAFVGGLDGLGLACVLATLAWLAVLQAAGVLRWHVVVPRLLGRGLARDEIGRVLGLVATAAAFGLAIELAGRPLARSVDAVSGVRPTSAMTYGLLIVTEALVLCGIGALAGATLPALRSRATRRRVRACGVAVATTGLACVALILGLDRAIVERFDVGRTLATVVDEPPASAGFRELLVVANGRRHVVRVPAATAGVEHDEETADRLRAWLDEKAGLTTLAGSAERYLLAERLAAFDLVGAQGTAWTAVRHRGSARTAHALLFALASAPPDPETLRIAQSVATTDELHLGPQALALLGDALERQGAPRLARDVRARLAVAGDERLGSARAHSSLPQPMVRGRLEVDGRPFVGRVGLVPVEDLEALEPSQGPVHGPVTWLLRLSATGTSSADGRFALKSPAGEQAIVVPAPGGIAASLGVAQ